MNYKWKFLKILEKESERYRLKLLLEISKKTLIIFEVIFKKFYNFDIWSWSSSKGLIEKYLFYELLSIIFFWKSQIRMSKLWDIKIDKYLLIIYIAYTSNIIYLFWLKEKTKLGFW